MKHKHKFIFRMVVILYIIVTLFTVFLNRYSSKHQSLEFKTIPIASGVVTDKFIYQENSYLTVGSKNIVVTDNAYKTTKINDYVNLTKKEKIDTIYDYMFLISALLTIFLVFSFFIAFFSLIALSNNTSS